MNMEELISRQRAFCKTGRTLRYDFRMRMLNRLERAVRLHEESIREALKRDLAKSSFESYMTEIGMVYSELAYVKKHLKAWMKPQAHLTPASQFPARSFSVREPYGVVLVMAPWNYPFMLAIEPLIGAIAGGNCCIVKPSAYAPSVSAAVRLVAEEAFPEYYVAVVEGGRAENTALLEQKFDYIFFTGSVSVGRTVMEKAAQHLTPVTLELGGKSPCIVEKSANLNLAAKRIVFGKFLNSGQTCVAPDYVYVEECVRERFLAYLKKWIYKMYGEDALECADYPKMINEKHFRRVLGLIRNEHIACGGRADKQALKIAPTVLTGITWDSPVMQEEIFGPVLPVLTFQDIRQVKKEILHGQNHWRCISLPRTGRLRAKSYGRCRSEAAASMTRSSISQLPAWDSAVWERAVWEVTTEENHLRPLRMRRVLWKSSVRWSFRCAISRIHP